jgi:hypothetical protein
MRPIQNPEQSEEQGKRVGGMIPDDAQCAAAHLRQMVWLAAEQHRSAATIAPIVRESEGMVRCRLKR